MSAALFNGRFLGRAPSGVDRFAIELLAALGRQRRQASQISPALQMAVPARAEIQLPTALREARLLATGAHQGHWWEQTDLPRAAGERPLISLCNTGPALRENQLVVIHDAATLANPGNFSLAFRSWYRVLLAALMRHARVVASVSKFSADELTRHLGRRARGIEVIHEGGEQILRQPPDDTLLDRLGLRDRRYVLAVGNRSPNKNFAAVLRALAMIDDPRLLLVAAGGGNGSVFADARLADPRLVSTGFVTDAQLRALYENAACFVFPSFYEGFGLPPLEAMCCGCPVIASKTSSLPEVCGDAVLYCDPADPRTLAKQMSRLLRSAPLRAELRQAGHERAALFSWDRAARHFNDIVSTRFA
jgi:glycosyltransferase involved in cell wall biosynthesis